MPYILAGIGLLIIVAIAAIWYFTVWRRNNSLPVKLVDENERVAIWIVCDKTSRFWVRITDKPTKMNRFVGSYKSFSEAWDMASRIDIRGLLI